MQRSATKYILNYPFPRLSYKERLISLDLMPLEFRRDLNDLLLLFKCRNGFVDVQFDKYLILNSSSYNTRNSDSNNYRPLTNHKQNYFTCSFSPICTNLWNNLPKNFKCCSSISLFKRYLRSHYKEILSSYHPP